MSDTTHEPQDPSAEEPAALNPPEPEVPAALAAAFDAAPADAAPPGADDLPAAEGQADSGTEGAPTALAEAASDAAAALAGADTGGGGGAATGAAVGPDGRSAAVALSGGLPLSVNVGPVSQVYTRAAELRADKALVAHFVTQERQDKLWEEIADLEAEAAKLENGSQLLVTEMIDRLASARNMLLHRNDQYENARREVVYVRYRLTRIRHSSLLEQPQTILAYLVVGLIAIVMGFFWTPTFLTNLFGPPDPAALSGPAIAGIDALTLFNTAFWGGLGGLAAAFFALQRHVEDFDQQHARWYYLSPLVGLFIGPLMGLVAGLGFPALFQMVSEQPANVDVRPALLYLLAWTVGYQQNLLLELVRSVLKRVLPEPEKEPVKTDPPIR